MSHPVGYAQPVAYPQPMVGAPVAAMPVGSSPYPYDPGYAIGNVLTLIIFLVIAFMFIRWLWHRMDC